MSSRSSSRGSAFHKEEQLLPFINSDSEKRRVRIRSVLGHYLYRRVVFWAIATLVVVSIFIYSTRDVDVYDVATQQLEAVTPKAEINLESSEQTQVIPPVQVEQQQQQQQQQQPEQKAEPKQEQGQQQMKPNTNTPPVVAAEEEPVDENSAEALEAKKHFEEDIKKMPWLRFPHLDAYYHGLKTLVTKANHFAEYPNFTHVAPLPAPELNEDVPIPKPYSPYDVDEERQTCYLDAENTVPVPDILAYEGMPQHMPEPVIGGYELLGMRDDVCFDRYGRYGPYGLGYAKEEGGTGVGLDTEGLGNGEVWAKTGKIDYSTVDWADAQDRCLQSNKHRFKEAEDETEETGTVNGTNGRTAMVIRTYTGFKWTQHVILNFRAMISELSLKSGGEYTVHFLLHVRDADIPIWADDVTVQKLLDNNVPPEFHGMVTLWSEPQMKLVYPGKFGEAYSNPSRADIHGVYRSAHLPLQIFAQQHPEYDHFWNWEMDMRFLGSYYELFDRAGKWATQQPRSLIWERSARYYIPTHHGSWENFTAATEHDIAKSKQPTTIGPLKFYGKKSLRFEQNKESVLPDGCGAHDDVSKCGIGEEADLITMNPIFNTDQSGWVFGLDATGYSAKPPPRRAAIITASRLSKRLLYAMHEEVWRHHHTMFSEMFPPSVAFHHGFKGVFAPHPIYLDRAWQPLGESIDAAFNGGDDHSTSGHGSPFDLHNEHNHKGSSWYYNSEFSGMLWRRWLGYAQVDGRGKWGGRGGEGKMRGGRDEEESQESSGRMCMRSVLLHPIKHEAPSERA